MDNKLKFQGLGGLDTLSSLAGTEKAVLQTATGPKLVPVALLTSGTPVAGGAGSIVDWDPTVDEAVGFNAFAQVDFEFYPELYMTATIDNTAHTVTQAIPTGSEEIAAFVIDGGLPRTGKFWFSVHIDFNNMTYDNWTNLYISSFQNAVTLDNAKAEYMAEIAGTDVYLRDLAGSLNTSQSPAVQKVLVCLDIDAGTIETYLASGLVRTTTVPAVGGVPGLACKIICATMSNYAGVAETLTFNFDPAQSPFAVPVGYVPLVMRSATLPVDPEGDFLVASASGQHHFMPIVKGNSYYVSAESALLESADPSKVPFTDRENVFTAPQSFGNSNTHTNIYGLSYVHQQGPGYHYYGPKEAPILSRFGIVGGVYQLWSHGFSSFYSLQTGNSNIGFGEVMTNLVTGNANVGIGRVMDHVLEGDYNAAMGFLVASDLKRSYNGIYIGEQAARNTGYHFDNCIAIGKYALSNNANDPAWVVPYNTAVPTIVQQNIAIGYGALGFGAVPGASNTAVGNAAMWGRVSGIENCAFGYSAMSNPTGGGDRNSAFGNQALALHKGGDRNIALGYQSGRTSQGSDNIFLGSNSGNTSTGVFTDVIAIGRATLPGQGALTNVVAIGAAATVTGSNQVQLGDSATTTYVFGTVQSRSDQRDKADVRNTVLGLEFIRKLRPVDYRWDMRDDYIDLRAMPVEPALPRQRPFPPEKPEKQDEASLAAHQITVSAYIEDDRLWIEEDKDYRKALQEFRVAMGQWRYDNAYGRLTPDGSHKRSRYHHGFIAQEVKKTADQMDVDFGGYQDHSRAGGQDVRSLGYEEFISPLVRAVQEVDGNMYSDAFTERMVNKVMERMMLPENVDLIAAAILAKMQKR